MRHEWIAFFYLCVTATVISVHATVYWPSDSTSTKEPYNVRDTSKDVNTDDDNTVDMAAERIVESTLQPEIANNSLGNFSFSVDDRTGIPTTPTEIRTKKPQDTPGSPKRYRCNEADTYYDCKISYVQLDLQSSANFGANNPQRHITFKSSTLEYLPKSLIDAFPNATLYNLENLKIYVMDQHAFENAQKLEELYLQDNRLKKITNETFQEATSLVVIQLSNNQLHTMSDNAFDRTSSLQQLQLDGNRLLTLPAFTNNRKLTFLNASHNALSTIADSHFSVNYELTDVDLSSNDLKSFSMEQFKDKRYLKYVNVNYNKLIKLYVPDYVIDLHAKNNSIEQLTIATCSLEILDLSYNSMKKIPSISTCRSLRFLDLSHNLLEEFSFAGLHALEDLNLAYNRLFNIEVSPTKLRILDISHNYLSHLPKIFTSGQAERLLLNNNKFIEFQFPSLQGSSVLTLSNNEWNCVTIASVLRYASDKRESHCANGFQSDSGICCKNYRRPYNDRLRELTWDAFFAEFSNEERIKKQCKDSQPGFQSPQISQQELDRLRDEAARADSATKELLQSLTVIKQQRQEITRNVSELTRIAMSLNSTTKQLEDEVERQRDTNNVLKEGLESSRVKLEKVINFVKQRNDLNADSVSTWTKELQQAEDRLKELEAEKNALETKTAEYKSQEKNLKTVEKNLKTEHDKLQASVNKNAPSLSGSG